MFTELVRPHGRTLNAMQSRGFLKRTTKSCYVVQETPIVGVGELFVWNKRIYVLKQEANEPFPKLYEAITWVNDIEIVRYDWETEQVGIIHKGVKKVLKNISKRFGCLV